MTINRKVILFASVVAAIASFNFLEKTTNYRNISSTHSNNCWQLLNTLFSQYKSTHLKNEMNQLFPKLFHSNKSHRLTFEIVNDVSDQNFLAQISANIGEDYKLVLKNDGHFQFIIGDKNYFVEPSDIQMGLDPFVEKVIGGGSRQLDPWPQDLWSSLLSHKSNWPPDVDTSIGPLRISQTKHPDYYVFEMDTQHPFSQQVGAAYQIRPKLKFLLDKNDYSLTVVVDQKNLNYLGKHEIASWSIAPIKMPTTGSYSSPQGMVVFPISVNERAKILNIENTRRWNLSPNKKLVLVNPYESGLDEPEKLLFSDTTWAFSAFAGDNQIKLVRSPGVHENKFQIYAMSNHAPYIEIEFTGPLVKPGETSSLLMKWESIDVSQLSNGQFDVLGETGDFQKEIAIISERLQKKMNSK